MKNEKEFLEVLKRIEQMLAALLEQGRVPLAAVPVRPGIENRLSKPEPVDPFLVEILEAQTFREAVFTRYAIRENATRAKPIFINTTALSEVWRELFPGRFTSLKQVTCWLKRHIAAGRLPGFHRARTITAKGFLVVDLGAGGEVGDNRARGSNP